MQAEGAVPCLNREYSAFSTTIYTTVENPPTNRSVFNTQGQFAIIATRGHAVKREFLLRNYGLVENEWHGCWQVVLELRATAARLLKAGDKEMPGRRVYGAGTGSGGLRPVRPSCPSGREGERNIALAGSFLDTPRGHRYNFDVFMEVKQ